MKIRLLLLFFVIYTISVHGQMVIEDAKYSDLLVLKKASDHTRSHFTTKPMSRSLVLSNATLPAVDLKKQPFFCRIEDEIARSSKVNFKFRLGSVQYVDALEGKAYFEAVGYSRATNFYMSRKQ